MRIPKLACQLAIGCTLALASLAAAQDTTAAPGVRLGLNYEAGTKPGVIVLPVQDEIGDDSLRVIVQRDLDYSDRMNVILLDSATIKALTPGGNRDRKSTRLNSSHYQPSRMPSSA